VGDSPAARQRETSVPLPRLQLARMAARVRSTGTSRQLGQRRHRLRFPYTAPGTRSGRARRFIAPGTPRRTHRSNSHRL